ncbi:hypothetical protein ACQ4LE_004999 [Meloidogyne hapla]
MIIFLLLIGVLAFSVPNVTSSGTDALVNVISDQPPAQILETPAARIVNHSVSVNPWSIRKKMTIVIFFLLFALPSLYLAFVPKTQFQTHFIHIPDIVKCQGEECSIRLEEPDPEMNFAIYSSENDNEEESKAKLTKVSDINFDKCDFVKDAKLGVNETVCIQKFVKGIDNGKGETIEVDRKELISGSGGYEAKNDENSQKNQPMVHMHSGQGQVKENLSTKETPKDQKKVYQTEEYEKIQLLDKVNKMSDFKHVLGRKGNMHQRVKTDPTGNKDKVKRIELEDHKHLSLVGQFHKGQNLNQRTLSDPADKDNKKEITKNLFGTLEDHKHLSLVDQFSKVYGQNGKLNQRTLNNQFDKNNKETKIFAETKNHKGVDILPEELD